MKLNPAHGVVAVKVAMLLVSLALISEVAQAISIQEFGRFILYFSLVNIFTVFLQMGLNVYLVKSLTKYKLQGNHFEANRLATQCLAVCMSVTLAISIALLLFLQVCQLFDLESFAWGMPSSAEAILLACWLFFSVASNLIGEVLKGNKRILSSTIVMTSLPFLIALMGLTFLPNVSRLVHILGIYAAAYAISFLLSVFLGSKFLIKKHLWPVDLRLITVGRSFLLMSLALIVVDQIDIWLISIFGSSAEVAIYGAINRLARLIFFSLVIINSFSGPLIAERLHSNELIAVQRYASGGHWVAISAGIFVYLMYLGFSDFILRTFFGEEFLAGGQVLAFVGAYQLINCATGLAIIILSMSDNQKWILRSAMLVVLAKILCCLILSVIGFDLLRYSLFIFLLSSAFNLCLVFFVWRCIRVSILPRYRNVHAFKNVVLQLRG